jgi:hypothetical protein
MFDKLFKLILIILLAAFLFIFYSTTQKGRYQLITQYEGSLGIFDTQQGVVYMLDIESDQWSVIKPFVPNRSI